MIGRHKGDVSTRVGNKKLRDNWDNINWNNSKINTGGKAGKHNHTRRVNDARRK